MGGSDSLSVHLWEIIGPPTLIDEAGAVSWPPRTTPPVIDRSTRRLQDSSRQTTLAQHQVDKRDRIHVQRGKAPHRCSTQNSRQTLSIVLGLQALDHPGETTPQDSRIPLSTRNHRCQEESSTQPVTESRLGNKVHTTIDNSSHPYGGMPQYR